MTAGRTADEIEIRVTGPEDEALAGDAAALIEAASAEHDIAPREVDFLARKIRTGRGAVALLAGELIGFGYWSDWQDEAFVSHSGLVVRPDHRGHGLGRKLKLVLFESCRARFPEATLMSLTTSPQVIAMNRSLGFVEVGFDRVTTDPEFWAGCLTCKRYEETQRLGLKCCCTPMVLERGE